MLDNSIRCTFAVFLIWDIRTAEKTRIAGAGGYVEYGRVNGASLDSFRCQFKLKLFHQTGNLALSRAIGDFEFKKNQNLPPEKQIITSDPDITIHDIDEEDEFLVLACDG